MSAELTTITSAMSGVFENAKTGGVTIVTGAIAVGAIFIVAKFIWGMCRSWLQRAKG